DFPWITFVHRGPTDCRARLLLRELGVSGEAVDVEVFCEECGARRRMSDAFGPQAKDHMPQCRGRRPHLRDYEEDGCTEKMQTILLGASNSWFSLVQSALSIPAPGNRLAQLVTEHWPILEKAANLQNIGLLRQIGQLHAFAQYSDDEVWSAVEAKRSTTPTGQESHDLKSPEWRVLSNPDQANNTSDFYLREVPAPEEFKSVLEKIVLVERLREVRALVGFTRIESPGDFDEMIELPSEQRAPLSRRPPRWIPATEIRGEGIFVQFKEKQIHDWIRHTKGLDERERDFQEAHRRWRRARGLEVNAGGFPGLRYVLLHSFSHALMRQLALEAGYSMASLRERIYSAPPEAENGPMAGVLLYTAAPDSEGTLGGLVRLGEPLELGRHIGFALEEMRLCASDPLCAEHHPFRDGLTLHGAACHACLFAPETSCERGNKYLDRWLLVDTIASNGVAFFHTEG
ncbi:MAG TPA: DUF1998 domain-containing protein, partial [Chloroflexota bacterium]|nr:DUF1998 domain-containing protein [Chloroflexota bacterium]